MMMRIFIASLIYRGTRKIVRCVFPRLQQQQNEEHAT